MLRRSAALPALIAPLSALPVALPDRPATDPPASVAVEPSIEDLHAALQGEHRASYLASTASGPVLYTNGVAGFRAPTRAIIADLRRRGALAVRSGTIPTVTLPNELRIPPSVATAAGSSYPDPGIGGVRYFIEVGSPYQSFCTTGFAVRHADGRTAMTSAGHCGWKTGQPIVAASSDAHGAAGVSQYSTVAATTWGTPGPITGDVLRYYAPSAKGYVYQGAAAPRKVSGWQDPVLSETSVCFRGASTGGSGSCGPVLSVGTVFDVGGYQFPAFCIDATPKPGDSGSPMYVRSGTDKASARGVLSFMQDEDGDQVYDNACGTPMSAVLSSTNTTLMVTP